MLATDQWSELVIHQCPRPNINNALLVWERLANSVAIPDIPSSRPISWCTWLTATAFSRYWVTHAVAQPCLQFGHHWTTVLPRRTTLHRPARVSEDTRRFCAARAVIYTLYWIFGTTKLCIYKVKSLVVLNISHINWGDIPYCVPPTELLVDMSPVPRFRRLWE